MGSGSLRPKLPGFRITLHGAIDPLNVAKTPKILNSNVLKKAKLHFKIVHFKTKKKVT